MPNFNSEKINIIPQEVTSMYRIEGYEGINYKKYLSSKNLFKSRTVSYEQSKDGQTSVLKIRNNILKQDKENIVFSITEALQDNDIEI